MFPVPEQFSAATKAQFEAQLKIMNALTSQVLDSAERVIALNIIATKTALEKSSAATKQLFAVQDPGKIFTSGTVPAPPDLATMMAYGRQLLNIAAPATLAPTAAQPVALEVVEPVAAIVEQMVAKPVAVAKPVVTAKPVAVAKPVVTAKPVAVAKPVVTAKPVAVAKPVVTAKPVTAPKKGVAPFPKSPVGK